MDLKNSNQLVMVDSKELLKFLNQIQKKPSSDLDQYVSRQYLKDKLMLSDTSLIRWEKRGYLTPLRNGKIVRYALAEVLHLLKTMKPES